MTSVNPLKSRNRSATDDDHSQIYNTQHSMMFPAGLRTDLFYRLQLILPRDTPINALLLNLYLDKYRSLAIDPRQQDGRRVCSQLNQLQYMTRATTSNTIRHDHDRSLCSCSHPLHAKSFAGRRSIRPYTWDKYVESSIGWSVERAAASAVSGWCLPCLLASSVRAASGAARAAATAGRSAVAATTQLTDTDAFGAPRSRDIGSVYCAALPAGRAIRRRCASWYLSRASFWQQRGTNWAWVRC